MGKGDKERTLQVKNGNGSNHPGNDRPSEIDKLASHELQETTTENLGEYIEITGKYNEAEDVLSDHMPIRHRNRKTSKGGDGGSGKAGSGQGKKGNQASTEVTTPTIPEQLPGVFSKETFQELANFKDGITVSIYLPAQSSGVEGNEHFDPISFKSTLNTVEQQLKDKGIAQTQIESLLKPGYELVRDDSFWGDLSEGIAVFIAEGLFKYMKMPIAPETKIVIEPTFYVTPLVPLMTTNEYFYLLTISKKTIKLFKADYFGMQIVPVDLPQGIEEVKRLSDLDATTYRHGESGRRAAPVSIAGQSHGAGGSNPGDKDNIATYFEAVDDILWENIFNKENAPLVLAGVEYEIPIYKGVCDYHNVWPASLTGNREYQETSALYKEVKELMQPFFDQRKMKALEMYGNKSATELTSSIVDDVIPATYYGRVSHLFVSSGEHVWGSFNEMENKLEIKPGADGVSEDLIDNAVVKTLSTGGEVFVLDKTQMPADSVVAAIFRY